MLAGYPFIQFYGWQQCHTLFDQTASDRWFTHTETEMRSFARSDSFSSKMHSAFCEFKENYETQGDESKYLGGATFRLLAQCSVSTMQTVPGLVCVHQCPTLRSLCSHLSVVDNNTLVREILLLFRINQNMRGYSFVKFC